MPIYEYRCLKCGEKFEEFRRISEADQKAKCPKCQSEETERFLSSFASVSVASGSCGGGSGIT
jgi:putative FmdB family regulatory protein